MDAPQSEIHDDAGPSGISRKSLLVWSLVILTIALLIGLAVYKRQFIEEKWDRYYGKKQVVPRKGSVYQLKRSSSVPAGLKTMPKMARKNVSAKANYRGAKTAPHQFAYLPTQGKFVEL